MMFSRRFRLAGFLATIASLGAHTASIAAEVGWSPPTPTATASTLWLNEAAGSSTLGQGMLQLNGPAESFVLTDPSTATHTGLLTLTGTVPTFRTSVATGSQDSIVGMIIDSGDRQTDNAGRTVVNALVADAATDVSRVTKTSRGTLLLDDASTYSGATTLFDGSLAAGSAKSFASGASGLNGGALSSPDFPAAPARTFANSASVASTVTFGDTLSPVNTGFSSGIDLQGAVRTFTTGANVTFDDVVANGGISKSGAAALTITGINTYAGGTTLTEGTLFAASNSALGIGPLALGSPSSPMISSDASGASASRTFANAVSVNGDVTFGDDSSNGAMLFASSANLGNAGETRVFTVNAKTTFGGVVTGGAGLTKTGSGVLTLSGSNSYSGGTTFASGMILAGSNGSFGTGALTFAGGAVGSADSTPQIFANSMVFLGNLTIGNYTDSMGALTFTSRVDLGNTDRRLTTKSDATFTGAIANGSITKDGLGALVLSGSNSYAGGTTLFEGTLLAGSDQAFGPGMLNLNGGIIGSASGQRSFANALSMVGGAVQFGDTEYLASLLFTGNTALAAGQKTFNTVADTTFTGILAGNGASLIKAGDGFLTLANANTYDGGTHIQDGAIRIANDSALGRGVITFGGGALASTTNATRLISNNVALNGGATIGDGLSNGAFVFNGANNTLASGDQTITTNVATTFVNGITGAGGLTKAGNATLTLKGENTYTGDTIVESGKLVLDGSIVGSKEIRLAAGAVLGGHGRFDGTISGYGSVDPGNSPGILSAVAVNPASVPATGNGVSGTAGGLNFTFEFNQLVAPTWSATGTSGSGNDVLLLTGTMPFTGNLTVSNTVNIYFATNLTNTFTASAWTSVQGGFFTVSNTNSLASAITGANFQFFFESGTSTVSYNGKNYATQAAARSQGLLPLSGQGFVVRQATVATANFDTQLYGGPFTDGLSMEIVSVPEPSTWVMGLLAAGVALARRRRLAGLLTQLRRSIPL